MRISNMKYPPKHCWVRYMSYEQALFDKISLSKFHCNTFNPVKKTKFMEHALPPKWTINTGQYRGGKMENSVDDFDK